jgi:hypothetical protein
MAEGMINLISLKVLGAYQYVISSAPKYLSLSIEIFLLGIIISLVSLFILYFYRSISKKNLISLNLYKYNSSTHPVLRKFLALLFYFLEYILFMPVLILIWFTALSIFILLLTDESNLYQILFIAAALVMSVRILAYWKKDLSEELAKLIPFVALATFILSPTQLNIEKIIIKISDIPSLLNDVLSFTIAIGLIEIFLRLIYEIFDFYTSESPIRQLKKSKLVAIKLVSNEEQDSKAEDKTDDKKKSS